MLIYVGPTVSHLSNLLVHHLKLADDMSFTQQYNHFRSSFRKV